MILRRENRNTWRKTSSISILSKTNPTWNFLVPNLSLRGKTPISYRRSLSPGTHWSEHEFLLIMCRPKMALYYAIRLQGLVSNTGIKAAFTIIKNLLW